MSWAFSQDRGYQALAKRNLFGFRLTRPHDMEIAVDRMGPDNERHLPDLAKGVGIIVAAWGNDGNFERSDIRVMGLPAGFDVYALALTKSGCSKHSLYVKGLTKPLLWRSERELNSTQPLPNSTDEEKRASPFGANPLF